MESFESWHDAEEWGPLSSTDGELVSVPDLVRRQMLAPLPLVPAVDTVLDAIERDGAVNWYLTTRGNYAIKVRDDLAWPDRLIIDRVTETGASSGTIVFGLKRPGTLGLMDYMRAYWMLRSRPRRLYDPVLDSHQLAILRKDADRLFGRDTSDPADVKTAPAAVQSVPVLPNDATIFNEVEALRNAKMRKTTAAVAEKYGVSVDTIERRCKAHKADRLPACSVFDQSRNRTRKAR